MKPAPARRPPGAVAADALAEAIRARQLTLEEQTLLLFAEMTRQHLGPPQEPPAALLRYLRGDLGRALPTVDPARILELLMPLYPHEEEDGTVHIIGTLAWVAGRQRFEPVRRAGLRSFADMHESIRKLTQHVAKTPLPEPAYTARFAFLAALEETARNLPRPPRTINPAVTTRGAQSARAWVAPIALEIIGYLRQATAGDPCSQAALDHVTARILSLASGQRITAAMVSDRTRRARGHK